MKSDSAYLAELHSRFGYMFRYEHLRFDVLGGWQDLFLQLCMDIDDQLSSGQKQKFYWLQVKEKMGGLRAYASHLSDDTEQPFGSESVGNMLSLRPLSGLEAIDDLIHEAESRSYKICIECGAPGHMRAGSPIRVLCDEHEARFQQGTLWT